MGEFNRNERDDSYVNFHVEIEGEPKEFCIKTSEFKGPVGSFSYSMGQLRQSRDSGGGADTHFVPYLRHDMIPAFLVEMQALWKENEERIKSEMEAYRKAWEADDNKTRTTRELKALAELRRVPKVRTSGIDPATIRSTKAKKENKKIANSIMANKNDDKNDDQNAPG